MVCHGRSGRRTGHAELVARALVLATLLLAPQVVTAQAEPGEDDIPAEARRLESRLDPAEIAVGDRFSLVISATGLPVDDLDADELVLSEPEYPDAVTKLAGASITESEDSGFPGRGGRNLDIEIPFRAEEAGRVIIEPLVLQTGRDTTWQTERHLLEIAVSPNDPTVPFDVSWNVGRTPVYEGQTVPVFLEIDRATSFVFPGEIDVDPPAGAVFEEVQGLGSVASQVLGGVELLRYPVATFLMTPSSAGELRIPSALVGSGDSARRAEARVLDVRPLPEAVRDTSAVGTYRFFAELSRSRLPSGESASLTLRAEGTGNLDFFRFPEVTGENLTIGSVGEQSEVAPVPRGLVGSRELRLRLTPRESGTHEVTVERFTWLEPETGRMRSEGPFRFTLEVVAPERTVAETRERVPFGPLSAEEIEQIQPVEMYRIPAFYLLFLPPLVTVVLALLGFGVKSGSTVGVLLVPLAVLITAAAPVRDLPREEITEAVDAVRDGRLTEAVWRLENLHEEYPRSPGILYNLGYASYLEGDRGGAVFALREALRLVPRFTEARTGLSWVEEQYGLDRQVDVGTHVHPDNVLVGLFVLAYVMAGLVFGLGRRRDARFAIGFISTSLLMIAAVLVMVVIVHNSSIPTAVVAEEGAALKQVPVEEAKDWLVLPVGTAVQPVERYDGYRLVRTGFGVEGWVEDESVLVSAP